MCKYKTRLNDGVVLKLARRTINTKIIAILAGALTLLDLYNTNIISVQMNRITYNAVVAIGYAIYAIGFICVIRMYNKIMYPCKLKIFDGKIVVESLFMNYAIETDEFEIKSLAKFEKIPYRMKEPKEIFIDSIYSKVRLLVDFTEVKDKLKSDTDDKEVD